MKRRQITGWALTLAFLAAFCAAGCSREQKAKDTTGQKGEKAAVAVETAAVRSVDLVEGITVTGTVQAKFETDVKAEIAGIVREVYVNDWVRVKRGTPLARIDTREYETVAQKSGAAVESSRAALLEAQAAANRAVREQNRMVQLKEAGLATQQSLDDSHTQAAAAQARVAAAEAHIRVALEDQRQAKIRLDKGLILSPMDGVVSQRNINVGDLAGDLLAGKPLFHIVDNRILNLVATVPSTELSRLRVGQALEFTTDALPGRVFPGTVQFINPAVNETDRSVKVIMEVENAREALRGGLFVKGRIVTGRRTAVLQVPRLALGGWNIAAGTATVFVIEGNRVRQRAVTTGALNGPDVEIRSGLRRDEAVVVRGGFSVRDGDRVTVTAGKGR